MQTENSKCDQIKCWIPNAIKSNVEYLNWSLADVKLAAVNAHKKGECWEKIFVRIDWVSELSE